MESVKDHIKQELKDPYFRELYEMERQKLGVARILISYRVKHTLKQKKLAKQMG